MELYLKRTNKTDQYTEGELYVNGEKFCDTLEDAERELPSECPYTSCGQNCQCSEKMYGVTCIPKGEYQCSFTFSPKFNRNLISIDNVPHFIGIRIHSGNTAKDSLGCVLVGEKTSDGYISNSRATETKLDELAGLESSITIKIE